MVDIVLMCHQIHFNIYYIRSHVMIIKANLYFGLCIEYLLLLLLLSHLFAGWL